MQRNAIDDLVKWKKSKRRKPLILKGARQVGKTWLMKEFAKNNYDNFLYISFDKEEEAREIFKTKDPKALIERLSILKNKPIYPQKTLLILDEIQDCANAIGSLKYFNEEANEYHIISAGSLLGTYLTQAPSFPVGKVNLIEIYPLTFDEFLAEMHEGMYQYYHQVKSLEDYVPAFHNTMLDLFRTYLIVGGMPEAVKSWKESRDPQELAHIHKEIINLYEYDFMKHNKKINAAKTLQVFQNIIPQLAKENNEKFIYSVVRQGARARDYEDAINWLVNSKIAHKINNIAKPIYPINAMAQDHFFKLFLLDVGIAKQMAGIKNKSILLNEDFYFKGQLMENYCLQQLLPQLEFTPHYYAFGQDLEIDFVFESDTFVVPVEVKAGTQKRATSFKRYIEKYKPQKAIRFNTNGFAKDGDFMNIPLYLASKAIELIDFSDFAM